MKKVSILVISFMLMINYLPAQIVISTNTIWATNQTLTSSVTVNPGATLTILPGVVVDVLFLDNNSDGIGDVKLTVNGKLRYWENHATVYYLSHLSQLQIRNIGVV